MLVLLLISLAANVAAGLVFVRVALRRRAARHAPDYAALAAERFAPAEDGCVVFAGDSQVGNAPLLDMLTPYRQWGIGGQTIADVRSWLPRMVDGNVSRLLLSAGTNDVLQGATAEEVVRRYVGLLDALPDVPVTILGVPALTGREEIAQAVGAGLRTLADERGAEFVDLRGAELSDGAHLTRAAYLRLGRELRDQVAG